MKVELRADEGQAVLSVADSGKGIAPEERSHLRGVLSGQQPGPRSQPGVGLAWRSCNGVVSGLAPRSH